MNQQKYPSSVIKVGAIVYRACAWTDEDTGSTSVDLEEWHVRSIKRKRGNQTRWGVKQTCADSPWKQVKYVNLTQKVKGISWGKRSRKHGDFGWLTSIPNYMRKQFRVGDELPFGFYTTPLQALRYELKQTADYLKDSIASRAEETDPNALADWDADIAQSEKEIRMVKTRITKLKNAKQ